MSFLRTFRLLANTQLVSTEAIINQQAGVQLTTFRTYASSAPDPNQGNKSGPANEETSPSGPSTDEIAHTKGAFEGGSANPEHSKKQVEHETGESMDESAADSRASQTPNGKRKDQNQR